MGCPGRLISVQYYRIIHIVTDDPISDIHLPLTLIPSGKYEPIEFGHGLWHGLLNVSPDLSVIKAVAHEILIFVDDGAWVSQSPIACARVPRS